MTTSILATKLYVPRPRSKIVLRPRLIERLNMGLHRRLTLISAPAGFGKTTLVSEWVAGCGRPTAWLSIDEGDSDPTRFLTYLVAALQTIAPNIGEGVLSVLQAPQPPLTESILTTLLNEIAEIPHGFVLVLDDYHMLDSKLIDNALAFLVERQPPEMHLVITTREDPNLPLARFRVRNQLSELRAADLRFTTLESAEFLNQVMGLSLSAENITALEARTEGWIAGLQLAALSMQDIQNVSGFIEAFAGDHRYIVDYLVEEVLQRQPEPIRNFLLQTAILDRLNGPLCDAVMGDHPDRTGKTGAKAQLETLQRGNFFLIPLDDKRHWYRYHHLFADVLRMHLMTEQPNQVPVLHRRASEWYEQNGLPADAIHHALAGGDFERAADLVELAAPAMHRIRQEATVLSWMKALPEELFRTRPVLSMQYVGTVMSNGGIEGVEARLRDAELWLDIINERGERPKDMLVRNEEEFRRLPGLIGMHRAGMALALGNLPDAMAYARRVLEIAPEDDYFLRGAAAALIGLAFWTGGDLEAAHRSFAKGMAHLQIAGNISDAVGGVLALADIRLTQGRLHDAMRTYERALELARENGTPGVAVRGTADMYVGMSELHREYNDLNTAMKHLLRGQELGELAGFPQNPYRWRVAMARIREAQGDLDGALDLLDEAEPLYVSDFFPNVRPIAALKARVWVAQGTIGSAKRDKALDWARERGLSAEDDVSYLHEFEHITLARILLAQYKSDRHDSSLHEVIGLLERLLKAAQDGGRMGSAIEILVLQALAHHAQGDAPAALPPLERALTLAEPEGYLRIFLDEGEPMRSLIEDLKGKILDGSFAGSGTQPMELLPYLDRLLGSFSPGQPATPTLENRKSTIKNIPEPLSQRELEVLRLFKTELSGPEIARELVIGLSTVRTHTKSIFNKLSVNNRRAAVKRAEELNLI